MRGAHCRRFFAWGMRQGLVDRNPCLGVERFPDRKRDRVLSAAAIKAVWDATSGDDRLQCDHSLLLLCGARASEIGGPRWDEIYSDRIVLPAERVKTNRQHMIFLTKTMRDILDSRKRRPGKEHVFGRRRESPFTGWGESKIALDARIKATGAAMEWRRARLAPNFCDRRERIAYRAACHRGCNRPRLGIPARCRWRLQSRAARGADPACAQRVGPHVREIAEGRAGGDRVVPLRARI